MEQFTRGRNRVKFLSLILLNLSYLATLFLDFYIIYFHHFYCIIQLYSFIFIVIYC